MPVQYYAAMHHGGKSSLSSKNAMEGKKNVPSSTDHS